MKKLLVLAISFCCCFLSSCATKQKTIQPAPIPQDKCDVPVWNVGDTWRWRYSNMKEWQYTVERIEKDFYVVEDLYGVDKPCLDKNTLSLMASINPQGEKKAAWAPSGYYFDFPLYIGKKWSKMITAPPARGPSKLFEVSYLLEFKCVSYEDVTVPAGTFKAFKITYKQTNMFSNLDGKVDIWYSPEIKVPIKVIFERIPYWSQLDFALVSFKLKEKQSPQPEKELSPQRVDTTPKLQTPLLEKPKISAPVTSSPSTNIVTITGTSANIRSGAGNEFSVITSVKQGEKLILLGEHGEWFNIRLENGQEGWISKMFTVPTSKTMNQIDLTDLSSLPRLWEGSWESKKNVTRGGSIKVNIIDVRENKLNGTIIVYNSVCPSASQFRGEVKNGKLIISADLGHPCGEMKAEAEPHGEGLQGLYEVGIPDFGSIRIHPK